MAAPSRPGAGWTTRADVVAALAGRWRDGSLLTALTRDEAVVPQQVAIRGPSARQVAEQFAQVQDWARAWESCGPGIRVEYATIGGRLVGTNQIPVRACVEKEADLWRLVGVHAEVVALRGALEQTRINAPELLDWARGHPRKLVAAADIWPRLLDVVRWIVAYASPAVYLRQIDVPGVDTKFVEEHRSLVAALLEEVLPADRIDHRRPRSDFAARYGLAAKPSLLRLRRLDGTALLPAAAVGSTGWVDEGPAELVLRLDDLARLGVRGQLVVVENEVTYLALPPLPDTVAIFGGGYAVSLLGALPWLTTRPLLYWGDLDTHGFVILNRLRAMFPQARSVLMDRATLEYHREHWETEKAQAGGPLGQLGAAEQALFCDLVEDRYGPRVRLEQERVRFGYAERALRDAL